jgi:GT2 family glycosyltransferase
VVELGQPRVSVVVPNWNGGELLATVLRALAAQTFTACEVIVVDNGSTDGSVEAAQELGVRFRVVELGSNGGFVAACNAGADAAAGELVAFLNNDAVPEPAWLEELVSCIDRHPRAACVDSKLFRLGSDDVLDGAGDELTWTLKAYRRGFGQPDEGRFDREEQILLASGTACLWRRDTFRQLGGFAAGYFAYYEDVDLSLRAQRAGHEIWFAPAAIARHRREERAAGRRNSDAYLAFRNRWATIIRNAPGWWLARKAPLIVLGEVLLLGRAVAEGELSRYARAARNVVGQAPALRRERCAIARLGDLGPERVEQFVSRRMPPVDGSLDRLRAVRRRRALPTGG